MFSFKTPNFSKNAKKNCKKTKHHDRKVEANRDHKHYLKEPLFVFIPWTYLLFWYSLVVPIVATCFIERTSPESGYLGKFAKNVNI